MKSSLPRVLSLAALAALAPGVTAFAQFTNGAPDNPLGAVAPLPTPDPSAPAAPSAKIQDISDVLATIGKSQIKLEEIAPYLAQLGPEQKAELASDPAKAEKFIRVFVVQRLLLKEALAASWEKTPEVVVQLERVRQNAIADSYLANASKPPATYPSDAEIREAYEKHPDAFKIPRQIRLGHIFILVPASGSDDKAKAKLAEVEKSLKAPNADFAQIAAATSDEKISAARGGDLGFLAESQIFADIRKQAIALPKGGTSAPIKLDDGWHIIKSLDIAEARTLSLDEVRDRLATRLRTEKARENSQDFVKKLLEQNPVAINQGAVSQLLKKAAN